MKPPARERVLFMCIGNSCRSQMAEAFARQYGSDILIPASAGLAPAFRVAPDTMRAMREKDIDLRDHFPKAVHHLGRARFDLIVNLSGLPLPENAQAEMIEWDVRDPISLDYEKHCEVRDEIEKLVMSLILDLRRRATEPEWGGQGTKRLAGLSRRIP